MDIILNKIKALYRKFGSLRWKLFYSYLFISMVPLLFYANTTLDTMNTTYTGEKEKEVKGLANRISTRIISENYMFDTTKFILFSNYIDNLRIETENRIIVVDMRGKVIIDSRNAETGKFIHSPEIYSALNKVSSVSAKADSGYIYAAVHISGNDGNDVAGAVLVISSMDERDRLLEIMGNRLILLTALMSLIMLTLVFFFSQLIIEPLGNILKVVKKMSEGHLEQRVKIFGHDEFSELGASFNDMADKLEKVDEARSEFVSNVSHELKTPLSSVKVLSESLILQDDVPNEVYKEFLSDINSEVDRMTKIVNDLLELVILDRKEQKMNISSFKINKTLEDMLKRLTPLASRKKIDLYLNDSGTVFVEGDEIKISLAISNLVENGIKYTDEGGSVRVILESDSQHAIITVRDTGIGISEADLPKVFTRFYRVDKTRSRGTGGTGLGLSITHKTVLLHNGNIKVMSKENEGTSFVVKIPLARKAKTREVH